MASEIILQPSAKDTTLLERREQLAVLRTQLAEREADLAQLRAQLRIFESRYMRQVGVLYAELDDLLARIAEREAERDSSDAARQHAEASRARARETEQAALESATEEPESTAPQPALKTLFREVAKRIHPDFAFDDAEARHFTLLMARANEAYRRGDAEFLQRMLDDHLEIDAAVTGESSAAEMLRLARQVLHARRDLAALDVEEQALRSSEVAQLQVDAEAAAAEYRDLLTELATGVRADIHAAEQRLRNLEDGAHV